MEQKLPIGTKVTGQYHGVAISGTIGFVDKEDYGVTLEKSMTIEGVFRNKVLVPRTPWKRALRPTWIKKEE